MFAQNAETPLPGLGRGDGVICRHGLVEEAAGSFKAVISLGHAGRPDRNQEEIFIGDKTTEEGGKNLGERVPGRLPGSLFRL